MVAAWDAGQLLNEAYFHLRQAVLLPPEPAARHWRCFQNFIGKLALVVREAVDGIDRQDRLRDRVLQESGYWQSQRRSEEFAEWIDELFDNLERRLPYAIRSGESIHDVRRTTCCELVAPVNRSQDQLMQEIEGWFDEKRRIAFRLAQIVDQGIRPSEIFREMFDDPCEPVEAEPGEGEDPVEAEIPFGGVRTSPEWPTAFPTISVPTTALPPSWLWYAEVEQRWGQLGLPAADLPARPSDAQAAAVYVKTTHATARQKLGVCAAGNVEFVRQSPGGLELVAAAANPDVAATVTPRTTPPRISIDKEMRSVAVDGTPHEIRSANAVNDPLTYYLALFEAKGEWIGPTALRTQYGMSDPRPDRLLKRLPSGLQKTIDADHKGSRIKPEYFRESVADGSH